MQHYVLSYMMVIFITLKVSLEAHLTLLHSEQLKLYGAKTLWSFGHFECIRVKDRLVITMSLDCLYIAICVLLHS